MAEKQVFHSLDEYLKAFLPKAAERMPLTYADFGVVGTRLAQQALEDLDAARLVQAPAPQPRKRGAD